MWTPSPHVTCVTQKGRAILAPTHESSAAQPVDPEPQGFAVNSPPRWKQQGPVREVDLPEVQETNYGAKR